MPYKKGKRVKRRTHKLDMEEEKQRLDAPKSMVFCRGQVGREVNTLMHEWREAMMPYTAQKLKIVKRNKVKDFVDLAKHFGCTTAHAFTCSSSATHFRVLKCPSGPSLTFRVESFKTRADIMSENPRGNKFAVTDTTSFSQPPLLVCNQFDQTEKHHQLIMATFKGMFPNIYPDSFKLSHCHRVMLVNYNKAHDMVEVRHYGILARTAGISTAAKKLSKLQMPKRLGELDTVEDLFAKGGDYLSDTDGEGEEVELTQGFRKISSGTQTRLKLVEIGPRMTLSLVKVESGFWSGETIFHKLYEKTPEEAMETATRIKMRERLRQMRKKEQDANVAKKKTDAADKKAAKEEERKRKREKAGKEENESDGDFEVMAPVADGDDDDEAPDAKRRRVEFDEDAEYAEGGDAVEAGAEGAEEGAEEGEAAAAIFGEAEDMSPRKRRKPISRQKRKAIKDSKTRENTRWES